MLGGSKVPRLSPIKSRQNGWAELVASNGRYNEWEGAEQLFGEQSKRFDRAVRTSDENQETDELIEQWLKLVAPELLSKPVSKCLEWLVRRFRIYEFNTLALVGVFLPYHQTSQFARMLQIVKLEDHAPLAFLKPLQKRGTPLPSSVLVAAFLGPAHTTPSLDTLRFITSLLPPNSGHAHRALVSFWTATLSQLCLRWAGTLSSGEMSASNASRRAGQKRPEAQDLLPILLPAATAVASTSKTEEARLGGMMVICALGSSFPLSEAAIRATLDALLVETPAHLRDAPTLQRGLVAVLLTLLSSAERPASESTAQLVSEQAVSTFLTMTHTVAELRFAGARYALRPFLQHFLPAAGAVDAQDAFVKDTVRARLHDSSAEVLELLLSSGVVLKSISPSECLEIVRVQLQASKLERGWMIKSLSVSADATHHERSAALLSAAVLKALLFSPALIKDAQVFASIAHRALDAVDISVHTDSAFQAAPGGQAGRQVDFQVILPALLLALNDADTSIRHAALSCIETVGKVASTAADSGNAEIFAFDRLYGRNNSSGLKYLQTKDAAQLCSDLAMSAQSFRHDAQYLPVWLSERLAIKREDSKHDSGYKRSVLSFLLSHVACWPSNGARTALLDALRGVSDASKLLTTVPLLRSLMQSLTPKAAYGSFIERYAQLLLSTFDGSSKSSIDRNVEGSWTVFKEAITSSVTFLQKQACSTLEERLARHLSLAHSKEMFEVLSSVATSPSHESIPEVSRVLRALKVETAWLVPVISDLRSSLAYTTLNAPASKRARTEDATSVEGGEATLPRRAATLTFILESIADRKLGAQPALIAELFEVLRVSTEMHTSQAFNADHTLQACLTCLHNTLGAVPDNQASTELVQSLRPDIVVNVVKASSNPQTFNQALLLLTKVVALAPEAVIHNAMPIFTFVGVSVLQRDDALSFSVVERVLRSILPPLVKSLRPAGTADKTDAHLQLLQRTRPFICIFTDAATHVPRHRRDVLFQLLVEVLGADEFLSAVTMLLVDQVAHKVVKQSPSDASATLALPIAVFEACSPTVQLHAVVQVLDEASRLWKHRDEPLTDAQAHTFLDPFSRLDEEHTGKHPEAIRRIRALTSLVRQALTLRSLTTSVAKVEGSETRSKASKSIANSTLLVIRRALELASIRDTDIGSSAREIASSLVRIAPPSMFIDFVLSFIADRDPAANRSGLELVSTRLPRLKQDARDLIADRTPKIIAFIAETLPRSTSDAATLQAAFSALESVAGSCVPSEHAALSSCLPALVDLGRADKSLRDAILRVTLPLSRKLGPRLIPHLSALAPFCLLCARQSLEAGHLNSRDAFDTLSGLVSAVPTFMPSYLNDVIEIAGNRALQAAKLESSPLRQAFNKLVNVYVKQIPAQQVLEMVSSRWEKAPRSSTPEHLAVLYFTDRLVRMSSKEDLLSVYKPVYRFLVRVFDLRREHAKELSAADLGRVEDNCVDAFVHLVLKLNETTFRPLFLRTYDWAAQDLLEDDDGEEKPLNDLDLVARRLVLYKLINGLLDSLKATVSLPTVGGRDRPSISSQTRHVCDVIGALALAVPDEKSLKHLNNLLLTLSRTRDHRVKVAALTALAEIWSKDELASTLLGLTPESVPHISELLDADDQATLEATNHLVGLIEGILGESLDTYLQ
ncbi:Uncharacterized conserved protein [Ceraceosorus bombacis]|uniref:U3 small nucleolar RNA-associated protein 10 n=1 Tax=Ceraceosorus bombacis TaxID=401625 RepID=A0A0P1BJE4_9BASI|nr:Uncharacterized conserved protein [Ceraceosorus bombacis]